MLKLEVRRMVWSMVSNVALRWREEKWQAHYQLHGINEVNERGFSREMFAIS